ncbi:uncharacterized protein LOC113944619 [Corapipo altera]|uniref:uncharacterized protein LOC113944619 n=1 Tax=Corapipo altera TaxID=415028 RepID=UPI000FD6AFCE|nr:uncharacterized protein LOC113944619 [Corapipo altera]
MTRSEKMEGDLRALLQASSTRLVERRDLVGCSAFSGTTKSVLRGKKVALEGEKLLLRRVQCDLAESETSPTREVRWRCGAGREPRRDGVAPSGQRRGRCGQQEMMCCGRLIPNPSVPANCGAGPLPPALSHPPARLNPAEPRPRGPGRAGLAETAVYFTGHRCQYLLGTPGARPARPRLEPSEGADGPSPTAPRCSGGRAGEAEPQRERRGAERAAWSPAPAAGDTRESAGEESARSFPSPPTHSEERGGHGPGGPERTCLPWQAADSGVQHSDPGPTPPPASSPDDGFVFSLGKTTNRNNRAWENKLAERLRLDPQSSASAANVLDTAVQLRCRCRWCRRRRRLGHRRRSGRHLLRRPARSSLGRCNFPPQTSV